MPKVSPTKLSDRQKSCLDFIVLFQKKNQGRTPATSMIAEAMKCTRQRAQQHLIKLEHHGVIKRIVRFQRQEIEVL